MNESQLITKALNGDQVALGELLQHYQQRLFNVALRMVGNREDAAELCQDAMLKIIQHIGDYNQTCAIATWMIRITMNLSISHLRKRRLRLTTSLDSAGPAHGGEDQGSALREQLPDDREPGPALSVEQREMIEHLHKAMRQLDDDFRAVLVLRDIDEMDYQQIAQVLGLPVGTVKSRLFRARLALREQLSRNVPSLRDSARPGLSIRRPSPRASGA